MKNDNIHGNRKELADFVMCPHPGANGSCMPNVTDGKCVWCDRDLPPSSDICDEIYEIADILEKA